MGGGERPGDTRALERQLAETTRKVEELHHRISVMQFMVDSHERTLMNLERGVKAEGAPAIQGGTPLPGGAAPEAGPAPKLAEEAIAPDAPAPALSPLPLPETAPAPTAEESYAKAREVFLARKFRQALPLFEAVAATYPNHKLANNALYWKGECHYALKEYRAAIENFDRLVREYPQGSKVPDAMLKAGYAYISLDKLQKARNILKKVITNHPFSPAGAKAEAMLKRIGNP